MLTMTTESEFSEWVEFHGSLYVGFKDWMDRNLSTLVEWHDALGGFTIHELRAASKMHIRRPNSEKATSYGNQLADLLEILRGTKNQEAYAPSMGKYAHVCGLCRNSGMVNVIAKHGFEPLSCGSFPLGYQPKPTDVGANRVPVKEFSVACKCQLGERFRARFSTFDATRMELPSAGSRTRCLEIIAKLREQKRDIEADRYERILNNKFRKGAAAALASAMSVPSGGEG